MSMILFSSHPSQTLQKAVYEGTYYRKYRTRCWQALMDIGKNEGLLSAIFVAGCGTVATTALGGITYLFGEGVARSYMELKPVNGTFTGTMLSNLGNAGGWGSLGLETLFTTTYVFNNALGKAEYRINQETCKAWIEENQSHIHSDPELQKALYDNIREILNTSNESHFFKVHELALQADALKIFEQSGVADKDPKCLLDRKLDLAALVEHVNSKTAASQYVQRILTSRYKPANEDWAGLPVEIIMGVALPIFFFCDQTQSLIGAAALGIILFGKKEDLFDTGHFPEWLVNAVIAMIFCHAFHKTFVLNPRDFTITREIFSEKLSSLQQDAALHNRFCDLANEELKQRAKSIPYHINKEEYQFQTI